MDVVSTTDDVFSFVDGDGIINDASQNIEMESKEDEPSEFEGLGSMFD